MMEPDGGDGGGELEGTRALVCRALCRQLLLFLRESLQHLVLFPAISCAAV